MEISHRIHETVTARAHDNPDSGQACDGALERLISLAGLNQTVGTKPPSDAQLARTGFSKYVKTKDGYKKAAGPPNSPDYIKRD